MLFRLKIRNVTIVKEELPGAEMCSQCFQLVAFDAPAPFPAPLSLTTCWHVKGAGRPQCTVLCNR